LIVEVLSPSTATFDRSDKFSHYRRLSTLQEYVLIDAEQMSVDRYRRLANRHWDLQTYIAGESLDLASVSWQESLDLLYEDVQLGVEESDSV